MWWEAAKWFAAFCWLLATLLMFSPKIAAESILPWATFLIGNFIWVADNIRLKNIQWIIPGLVFCALDIGLICSRVYGMNITKYFQPILTIIERLI